MRPEEWEALREKFRGGQAEQPDGTTGEAHPEIDAMLEAKSWFARYGSSKATGLSILL